MRSWLQNRNPIYLLWVAGLSSLVFTATTLTLSCLSWHLPETQRLPKDIRIAGVFIIFLAAIVSVVSELILRRGLRRSIWSESQLADARRMANHSILHGLVMTPWIFAIIFLNFISQGWLFSLVFFSPLSFLRILQALRPEAEPADGLIRLNLTPNRPD